MLRIKLQRVGKKNDPSFRVVVTDKRTGPKSNKHVAQVGHYDAIRKTVVLNKDEINEWIAKGAQPTDTVHNILVKEKVIEGEKRNVLSKKTPISKSEKDSDSAPKVAEVTQNDAEVDDNEEKKEEEVKEEEEQNTEESEKEETQEKTEEETKVEVEEEKEESETEDKKEEEK